MFCVFLPAFWHTNSYIGMYLSRSVSYKVEDTDICYILTGLQLKGKKKKPRFSKKLRCNFRLPVTVCHMIIFRVSHLCCILFKLTGRRYISFVLLNWDLSIVIVKLYLHKLPFQKAFMIKRFTERRFFLVLSLFTDRQGYAGWQIVLLSSSPQGSCYRQQQPGPCQVSTYISLSYWDEGYSKATASLNSSKICINVAT